MDRQDAVQHFNGTWALLKEFKKDDIIVVRVGPSLFDWRRDVIVASVKEKK